MQGTGQVLHLHAMDADGDGAPDVVEAGYIGWTLLIGLNRGTAAFGQTDYYETAYYPMDLTVGYFDNDGRVDTAIANYDGTVTAHLNHRCL